MDTVFEASFSLSNRFTGVSEIYDENRTARWSDRADLSY
jgi:hypothetical protein